MVINKEETMIKMEIIMEDNPNTKMETTIIIQDQTQGVNNNNITIMMVIEINHNMKVEEEEA